ncbi:hypothetical protein [Helicobacter canis]|uniref:hypothetical protein n=1 Tax=Helicobacter canis TaxID=29419 RepID=UPI000E0FF75C|nr:hypothetical protein [Helicobacter canis]
MSLLCFGGLYTRIHKCLIFYPYLANDDFHNKIAQNSSLESQPQNPLESNRRILVWIATLCLATKLAMTA